MSIIKANNWQLSDGFQTNAVVQTVSSTFTGASYSNSTSYVAVGHSVTITPKFANSKLMIIHSWNGSTDSGSGAKGTQVTIYRDGSNLFNWGQASSAFDYNDNSNIANRHNQFGSTYIVNSNSTASTTFSIYHRVSHGTSVQCKYHGDWGAAVLTVMEYLA
jgi:hypothetical protein